MANKNTLQLTFLRVYTIFIKRLNKNQPGMLHFIEFQAILCFFIAGSAVAMHCCKAHSKINRKMENSTPCKIVTPENFILKLSTRDYVENITH